ncbi:thioester reductase domain-containing protein [Apiospora hydei]|uniref:Thioester reductase domain-containing protein n=1 Tax=Apiospora hydei TaxID=1337664 RepID=A0ABR1VXM3_9PEZI
MATTRTHEPVSPNKYTKSPGGGKRLIPNIVDKIASQEPQREWAQIPVSSDPKDGWKTVTFQQFANAINRCCHLIIERTGQAAPGTFPTVAYIGPNDARYLIIMIAAIKTGRQVCSAPPRTRLESGHVRLPRNSQEAQFNLFDKTGCKYIAFPESHKSVCQPLLDVRQDMKAIPVMPLDAYMDETAVSHYPFDRTFEEAEWDPMVVLHTSGSTGLPKPIIVRQGMFALADAWMDAPELDGMKPLWSVFVNGAKRHYCTMPLFHAAGLYMSVWFSLYYGRPIALGIADKPLSSDLVVESLKNVDVQAAVLPPAILEDMSLDDEATKALAKLHAVGFGGGNLAQEAGDRLVEAGVRIVNVIATTECSIFPLYWNENPKLWHWFIFNPNICGIEWRRQKGETDDEDVYEQVYVRRHADPGAHIQGYFYTFPEENEISTKDLYTPHPTLPHHWLHHGRADDIIVFSNGEKLNPVTIEEIVEDHPQIKGVVVVGAMRFQPAMIIEPVTQPENDKERQELIESVYMTKVQKANEQSVAHGRIDRDHIMIARPDKPFPRAGKGTIQRAAAVKLYKDDIDELYDKADQASEASAPTLDVASEDALAASIVEMFQSHIGASKLEPDADFFSAGIDSMQVIKASRILRAGLAVALSRDIPAADLTTRVVYTNPSPRMLARYIMQNIVASDGASTAANPEAQHQRDMTFLWDKYTQTLMPKPATKRPEASDTDQTVLITGTTGMLGSYMLDIMARSPRVRKIICLNRPDDGGAGKQTTAMQERGLDGSYGGKAEFLQIDASQPNLGLRKEVYARLQQETDRVVLNAWPVNFNMPVLSFEPHIRGVRNWADFAATTKKRAAVVFVSSIGTVDGWKASGSAEVPEARFEDMSLARGGYGASKMVASLVLEDASRVGDFPAAAIRVGQIAGPERDAGVWNRQEWLPSIVASSLYLKALPSDLGGDGVDRVDWTPGERIANLVLEVDGITQPVETSTISGYYHGANPSATTWAALSRAVLEYYGKERLPETVSFAEWVRRLEKTQEEGTANLAKNPGVKLLDSYRQMAKHGMGGMVIDMTRTKRQSPTMRGSEAITPELMKQWCKHWGF